QLKAQAEQAKIRLSRNERVELAVDFAGQEAGAGPILFEHELTRGDVESIAEPVVIRSINICRKLLKQTNLGAGHIDKIVLVGGPTLMPFLRERLADPKSGLGIPLDFSVNPLTVVARGAAVFAATQRLDAPTTVAAPGHYLLHLEYKPVGA